MSEYISVTEAARIIGIAPNSVRYAVKSGKLKGHKSGGVFLVEKEAAENYVKIGHRPQISDK